MASRSSTINTRSRKATPHLWPSGTGAFVRRRMIEFAGMALAGIGAALAIAGLSFRAEDPSFNRADDGPVMNLLGLPGAYAADLMWQTLGLAAFLLPFILMVWGLGICRRRGFRAMAAAADMRCPPPCFCRHSPSPIFPLTQGLAERKRRRRLHGRPAAGLAEHAAPDRALDRCHRRRCPGARRLAGRPGGQPRRLAAAHPRQGPGLPGR